MGDSDLGYIRVSRIRHKIVCRTFHFLGKVGILYIREGFLFISRKTSLEKDGNFRRRREGGFGQGLMGIFHTPLFSFGNFNHENVLLIHKVTKFF